MKAVQRVKDIIEYYELSVRAFEKQAGLANNTIQASLKREGNLNEETLNSILSGFPDINPTWLLTGKGSMFTQEKNFSMLKTKIEELEKKIETMSNEFNSVMKTVEIVKRNSF